MNRNFKSTNRNFKSTNRNFKPMNRNFKPMNRNKIKRDITIYQPNNNDIEDLLMNLNKYSLTNKNIVKSIHFTEKEVKKQTVAEVKITKKKNDYFYPSLDCKDNLFWCWITHHFGSQEYELNKNDLYNYEINKKFEYVSYIRGNKHLLKSLKLNRIKLEENLLDDNGIDLGLFTFICLVHKYNIIYTDNYMYYEYIDEFNNDYIMINKRNNKYGLYIKEKITKDNLESFKKNKWIIESITKPLRSVSSYKVGEIREICKIMNIDVMKTEKKSYTKNELYEKIKQHIM